MEIDIKLIDYIFSATRSNIRHQQEKDELKGEKFNIFSVLNMERKENDTHSKFLCELLNPKGTHLKGNLFLSIFLKQIQNDSIDLNSAEAKTEHVIGRVDNLSEQGGRIDIYIWDKNGNSISIENKIDAGDQYAQIKRYCNFNKNKNVVYYLTKFGNEPTEISKDNLVSGQDFFLISYENEIIQWLQNCIKECYDAPVLRETIKQYINLIKKITNTMNPEEERILFDLILRNQKEAAVIANNYNKAILSVFDKLRKDVFEELSLLISDKYNVFLGYGVDKPYSQIWIKIKDKNDEKIIFGVQGFSIGDKLITGIYVVNGNYKSEYELLGEKKSNCWINIKDFGEYHDLPVDINNPKIIYELFTNPQFQKGYVNHIVKKIVIYLNENFETVNSLL